MSSSPQHSSTADTDTLRSLQVFSRRRSMAAYSQEMAQGIRPSVWRPSPLPTMLDQEPEEEPEQARTYMQDQRRHPPLPPVAGCVIGHKLRLLLCISAQSCCPRLQCWPELASALAYYSRKFTGERDLAESHP